jgi:hypothetical protein
MPDHSTSETSYFRRTSPKLAILFPEHWKTRASGPRCSSTTKGKTMINRTRIAIVAAFAASSASQAFAEFLKTGTAQNDAEGGLGYYAQNWNGQPAEVAVRRHHGLHSFAPVPADPPAAGFSLRPSATGGSSVGYNENLRKDQW